MPNTSVIFVFMSAPLKPAHFSSCAVEFFYSMYRLRRKASSVSGLEAAAARPRLTRPRPAPTPRHRRPEARGDSPAREWNNPDACNLGFHSAFSPPRRGCRDLISTETLPCSGVNLRIRRVRQQAPCSAHRPRRSPCPARFWRPQPQPQMQVAEFLAPVRPTRC